MNWIFGIIIATLLGLFLVSVVEAVGLQKREPYGLLKSDGFGAIFGIGGFGVFCSDIGFRLEAIRWC